MDQNNSDLSTIKFGDFVPQEFTEQSLQVDVLASLGLEDFQSFAQIINNLSYDIGIVLEEHNSLLSEVILGNGSFATVYKATKLQTDTQCALKYFQNENQHNLPQIVTEFHIQYELNQLYKDKYLHFQSPICLIQTQPKHIWNIAAELELGECTLYQYILSEQDILHDEYMGIFYQVLDSILSMHEHKYAHRDIKPQNIIYVKEKGWLISDFGCAMKYESIEDEYAIAGTKAFNYEVIRKQIKQLFGQQQYTNINLLKNDLFAFCLTMAMLKYPKKTVIDCQQMIENQSIEVPELNQIIALLDDKKLLPKMQSLIPFQYDKTNLNLNFIKQQDPEERDCFQLKLLKLDALINTGKQLDINQYQSLIDEAPTAFLKQQIQMKYFNQNHIKEQIKPSLIIFPDRLSSSEANTLHNYLSIVGQYTKLLEIVPRCKNIGNIDVRIMEISYYILLNQFEQAYTILNSLQAVVNNFTLIDIAFYYTFKQILISKTKKEFYQPLEFFYQYFKKLGSNTKNICFQFEFHVIDYFMRNGEQIDLDRLLSKIEQPPQIILNQFNFMQAQRYYYQQNQQEIQKYTKLVLTHQNPRNLGSKELLLELIGQEVIPIMIETIIFQIAQSYFMLKQYEESCDYQIELINYCIKNSQEQYLSYYYYNYGLAFQQMGQYDNAISTFKIGQLYQNSDQYVNLSMAIQITTTYLLMGSMEEGKQSLKLIQDSIKSHHINLSQCIILLKQLTNISYTLIQKNELQQAKSIQENSLFQEILRIKVCEAYSSDVCTMLQVGSQLYFLLKDYNRFIILQNKILSIQTEQSKDNIKYEEIGKTLLNLAKANKMIISPTKTVIDMNQILNYYQQFIDLYINNDPFNPTIIEVYEELIDFCQEQKIEKSLTVIEGYVAYMIEHFGVENTITQKAIKLLEAYE